jgi:ubiquinone/menaquinone biosynthesis C-methylase UbiE
MIQSESREENSRSASSSESAHRQAEANRGNGFVEQSYRMHEEHFMKRQIKKTARPPWQDQGSENTVGAWRHQRFFSAVDPFIQDNPYATWLTVGDGGYGIDAHYIESKGASVIASDISTHLLEQAHEAGYISEYARENAEAISLPDNSIDYLFCKHACHHFPRPYIAIHEMLRVARKAVILEEPADPYVCRRWTQLPLTHLRRLVNRLVASRNGKHDYEPVGNYLYKFSEREFEKLALGMGLTTVAFRGINDFYHPALARATITPCSVKGLLEKLLVGAQDGLMYAGLLQPVVLVATLFKSAPTAELRKALRQGRYAIVDLPGNPYVSAQTPNQGTAATGTP